MDNRSSKFLDELAKFATDAAGLAQGARGEFESLLKSQGERLLSEMDLVDRESFEAVKQLAQDCRADLDILRKEVALLKQSGSSKG